MAVKVPLAPPAALTMSPQPISSDLEVRIRKRFPHPEGSFHLNVHFRALAGFTILFGASGAGKTTLLRLLAGAEKPDTGGLEPGHGLRIGYFAQEHDTLDNDATVWQNIRHAAPESGEQDLRGLLGAFMFSGPQLDQLAGTLSGGEKTRLALAGLVASTANVLLLDEPTNNLDPASREQVLDALRSYHGAVVLVTHDPGAAEALDPQRVVLLPDGTEDYWSDEYRDLIELA